MLRIIFTICIALTICIPIWSANAATSIPFTISTSETVNVTGTPRIAVDVGGVTRYATYTSGTGTSSLTFTYTMVSGDVDLDGVTLTSPMQLNGGTIKDLNGNDATLTFTVPNTANVKVNYPSLGMDFVADADGRYTLNGTAYNDLTSFLSATGGTFTRASIGTYYDASGILQTAASGTPRFDYDPVTHVAKGILIEESRTNLLLRSGEFDNAAWIKANITASANSAASPDGVLTAETITIPVGAGTALRRASSQDYSFTAGATYTASVYAKYISGSFNKLELFHYSGAVAHAIVNLTNGNVVAGAGGIGNNLIVTNVGNGWYKISLSFTAPSTVAGYISFCPNLSGFTNSLEVGDNSQIALWGAQLEQGSFPTSYIPTTATTVTRAADNFTVPTGAWFNSGESTVFSDTTLSGSSSSSFLGVYDLSTSGTERFGNYYSLAGSSVIAEQRSSGTARSTNRPGSYVNTQAKAAASPAITGMKLSVNGSAISTSASGGFPTASATLHLGIFDAYLNGTVSKFKYYPARVTDTQLQLLTQ